MAKKLQRTSAATATAAPPPSSGAGAAAGAGAPIGVSPGAPRKRRGRVGRQIVTEFTIQLATLTEAGIPIVKALTILEGQTRPGPFKTVLGELVEDVAAGTPLSESMAKHPKVFDRLYASMVRAGEAGGVLD